MILKALIVRYVHRFSAKSALENRIGLDCLGRLSRYESFSIGRCIEGALADDRGFGFVTNQQPKFGAHRRIIGLDKGIAAIFFDRGGVETGDDGANFLPS